MNLNIFCLPTDQELVSEQTDEAKEDGAGRPSTRLPSQRGITAHALP